MKREEVRGRGLEPEGGRDRLLGKSRRGRVEHLGLGGSQAGEVSSGRDPLRGREEGLCCLMPFSAC